MINREFLDQLLLRFRDPVTLDVLKDPVAGYDCGHVLSQRTYYQVTECSNKCPIDQNQQRWRNFVHPLMIQALINITDAVQRLETQMDKQDDVLTTHQRDKFWRVVELNMRDTNTGRRMKHPAVKFTCGCCYEKNTLDQIATCVKHPHAATLYRDEKTLLVFRLDEMPQRRLLPFADILLVLQQAEKTGQVNCADEQKILEHARTYPQLLTMRDCQDLYGFPNSADLPEVFTQLTLLHYLAQSPHWYSTLAQLIRESDSVDFNTLDSHEHRFIRYLDYRADDVQDVLAALLHHNHDYLQSDARFSPVVATLEANNNNLVDFLLPKLHPLTHGETITTAPLHFAACECSAQHFEQVIITSSRASLEKIIDQDRSVLSYIFEGAKEVEPKLELLFKHLGVHLYTQIRHDFSAAQLALIKNQFIQLYCTPQHLDMIDVIAKHSPGLARAIIDAIPPQQVIAWCEHMKDFTDTVYSIFIESHSSTINDTSLLSLCQEANRLGRYTFLCKVLSLVEENSLLMWLLQSVSPSDDAFWQELLSAEQVELHERLLQCGITMDVAVSLRVACASALNSVQHQRLIASIESVVHLDRCEIGPLLSAVNKGYMDLAQAKAILELLCSKTTNIQLTAQAQDIDSCLEPGKGQILTDLVNDHHPTIMARFQAQPHLLLSWLEAPRYWSLLDVLPAPLRPILDDIDPLRSQTYTVLLCRMITANDVRRTQKFLSGQLFNRLSDVQKSTIYEHTLQLGNEVLLATLIQTIPLTPALLRDLQAKPALANNVLMEHCLYAEIIHSLQQGRCSPLLNRLLAPNVDDDTIAHGLTLCGIEANSFTHKVINIARQPQSAVKKCRQMSALTNSWQERNLVYKLAEYLEPNNKHLYKLRGEIRARAAQRIMRMPRGEDKRRTILSALRMTLFTEHRYQQRGNLVKPTATVKQLEKELSRIPGP